MHLPIHQECNPPQCVEVIDQYGLHIIQSCGLPHIEWDQVYKSNHIAGYIHMHVKYPYPKYSQRYITSKLPWIYLSGFQTRPSLEAPFAICVLIFDSCWTSPSPNSCLESSSVEPPTLSPVGFTKLTWAIVWLQKQNRKHQHRPFQVIHKPIVAE